MKKQVSSDEVEKLIKNYEKIPGTDIKIVVGKTKSNAVITGGEIIKENNYIVHLFDGDKIVSMASKNIDIDLRKIVPEIGKILGGGGGGKPRMTQCGGPNRDRVDEALKKAKKLTIKNYKK